MRRPLAFHRCCRSVLPLAPLLAAGCSSAAYAADADREVGAILTTAETEVLGNRSDRVVRPKPAEEPPAQPDTDVVPPAVGPPPPPRMLPVDQVQTYDLARPLEPA